MKKLFLFVILAFSFSALASECSDKVIGHYKAIYHRTYGAASNTFLNNFVGRKNMFAHTFGEPRIAFLGLAIIGENYIAQGIVDKACKSGQEVFDTYIELLESGALCRDLGEDYKKPRKIKKYLLQHF